MERDDDKTLLRGTATRTSPSGHEPGNRYGETSLPIGMRLGEFEIAGLIGKGGFGIVYLAYDHSLDRHVALKEYMPSGIASRTATMNVTASLPHYSDIFAAGLRSFMNEARLLARFDSPSLVKVHRFWEANGTAYMVMPFYEGVTLKEAYLSGKITPHEAWVRTLLDSLLGALETIHREHCLHRDIAPDNILLCKDGSPLLLDFGAARRVISDLTHMPTVIVKPGFAPIEQYTDISALKQGPWTDIYALAAVVYYLIAGKPPPDSMSRVIDDEMVPARVAGKGAFSERFLAIIDHALAVRPEQRIRSAEALRQELALADATCAEPPPASRQPNPVPPTPAVEPADSVRSSMRDAAPASAVVEPTRPETAHKVKTAALRPWPYALRVAAAIAILGASWLIGVQVSVNNLYDNLLFGDRDGVEGYLEAGGSPDTRNGVGQTPLMKAAMFGDTALVNKLLAAGADVNAQSNVGESALWVAAYHGHPKVVRTLLAAGAEWNMRYAEKTPLDAARSQGHTDIVEILIQAGARQ